MENEEKVLKEANRCCCAFPSISAGVYHFPVQLAAQTAVRTVREVIAGHPDDFDVVLWVLFDERTEAVYHAEEEGYGRDK